MYAMAGPSSDAKRTRAYHNRSKLGCLTCRARRVKCDQTRPACQKCTNSGRSCDGYLIAARTSVVPITIKTPMVTNLADGDEQRSLQYFRECTAPQFAILHDHEFWLNTVLQVSANEQCVLHSVIAIATLHEAFENDASTRKHTAVVASQLRKRSNNHYVKAISILNSQIVSRGWQSLHISLLCCLLCVGFEGLRGSYSDARIHLTHGLTLLKQWTDGQGSPGNLSLPSATEDFIRDSIAPNFNRMALQVLTTTTPPLPWNGSIFPRPEMEAFGSFNAARDSLYYVVGRFYMATPNPENLPPGHGAIITRMERSARLSAWFNCYTRSCAVPNSSFTSDVSSRALLQATFAVAKVIVETDLSYDQMQFDKYTAEFKEVIRCANIHVAPRTSTFSMDMAIVPLLHYVSMKCRDPVLRRQAIAALDSTVRREGMWDSAASARLAREMLEVEEGAGSGVIKAAKDVKSSSRIEQFEKSQVLEAKRMTVRFKRQGHDEWDEERVLTW
ncbi:unnamed protein product [Periconia digitata]|uniref:Zn(2)-C6 fungal-type domain-containing protein n=1 Tax=Periconia digitata TaxID=1303443 RepID=A0A9W4UKP8_9PLEO|nr:unnamed protein product [Periconia digitata]